ncbi:MAG: hypothetical protein K2N81_12375 [Acetatifactor sp.]|nr:hypothetical protein [Acetatifactor sp.]
MEKKKTIFDYLAHVMIIFGFTMLGMNIFCLAVGNSAKGVSTMFELGSQGIPVKIAFEFLCLSALIVGVQFVFFTDIFIKRMSIWLRTTCMLSAVLIIIIVFVIMFHWFPLNMWQPWVLFFVCFGISFLGSCLVMTIKEKIENRRMEEALQRLKTKGEK